MKINTGGKWGKTKVPKLRHINSTSSAGNQRNVPSTARDSVNRNSYDNIKRSGSLSARETMVYQKRNNQINKTKKIIKNVNTRTALSAKIKALAQLDLNSNINSNNNKPSTPKQQVPAFRRAYKLSNDNGNVTRNSKPEINDTSSDEESDNMDIFPQDKGNKKTTTTTTNMKEKSHSKTMGCHLQVWFQRKKYHKIKFK